MTKDSTKASNRKSFLEWYHAHEKDVFEFNTELENYCRSDIDILCHCCLQFRELFMEITASDDEDGINPFATCITIASACNLFFRTKYLQPNTIGIIPAHGYRPEDRQSKKALQWIKYQAMSDKIYIHHSQNTGEKNRTIQSRRVL